MTAPDWREDALNGRLPVLPEEREYSTRGILATGFTYAVAAWCFLIGGYAANVVGAWQGIVALLCGCTIGVALSAVAAALACNKYGLEQIDYTKSCFGQRGALAILVFYTMNQIGWTGMILVMFGRGLVNVGGAFGLAGGEHVTRVAVLASLIVAFVVVVRGVHVLNLFNAIVTPGLLIATGLLFYAIFKDDGWTRVTAAAPLAPTGDTKLDYVIALECGLGAGFSWWPGIGFLTRNTRSQRDSLYPQVVTGGVAMGLVCVTGLLAGLAFRTWDPTVWMVQVGGRWFGAAALLLVAIANISASAIMMYTGALGLRHVRWFKQMAWPKLVAITCTPVLAYVAFPEQLYEKGSAWLTYNATMFAPISAILLVDYLVLRRQRINASQIFESAPGGDYHYVGGVNWLALVAMFVGQGAYIWLLNPVDYTVHGPVRATTATFPAIVLPMLLYYVFARVIVIPRGQGGYRAPTTPRPIRNPNL